VRFKLRLPVIYRWSDGNARTEGGFTVDISKEGALIRCQSPPPIGSDVQIDVLVPWPDGRSESVRVQCIGHVTRALSLDHDCVFAVSGSFAEQLLEGDGTESFDSN
jgi:hypothetical protein